MAGWYFEGFNCGYFYPGLNIGHPWSGQHHATPHPTPAHPFLSQIHFLPFVHLYLLLQRVFYKRRGKYG
jgi:hypothetical protein